MTNEANPYIDAHATAQAVFAARAPFYAVVTAISGAYLTITPSGATASLGACPCSPYALLNARVGDKVACIWVGATPFVLTVVAAEGSGPSVWLDPGTLHSLLGTPDYNVLGSSGVWVQRASVWLLDAATDEAVGCTFQGYVGAALAYVTSYFAPSTGGTGNIRVKVALANIPPGAQVDVVVSEVAATVAVPGVVDQVFTATTLVSLSGVSGEPVRFGIQRMASDAADTYAADVGYLGSRVQYVTAA